MAYADPDDMMARYDWREVGELVSDNNEQADPVQLRTDPNLAAALADASGEVDSALLVGGNYTPDQLAELEGNSLARLKNIVCLIAIANLMNRRPLANWERYQTIKERVDLDLDKLRKGENILNIPGKAEAGLPSVGGYTTVEVKDLNLVRDRVRNFFPRRVLPGNR